MEEIKPGLDSEFYLIERPLSERGYARYAWETWSSWISRIEHQSPPISTETLKGLLVIHYRYRFDPEGINSEDRAVLKLNTQRWLEQNTADNAVQEGTDVDTDGVFSRVSKDQKH